MLRGRRSWFVAHPEYAVVPSTGKYHIRYRVSNGFGERVVDDGRCGADETWVKVDFITEQADESQLCDFCWPEEGR